MRHTTVAIAVIATMGICSACGSQPTTGTVSAGTPVASASASATTATTAVDVATNTKQVCATSKQLVTAATNAITAKMNEYAAARDAGQAQAALAATAKIHADIAATLDGQAALAAGAELKTTLTDMATALREIGSVVEARKTNQIASPKYDASITAITAICGPNK